MGAHIICWEWYSVLKTLSLSCFYVTKTQQLVVSLFSTLLNLSLLQQLGTVSRFPVTFYSGENVDLRTTAFHANLP